MKVYFEPTLYERVSNQFTILLKFYPKLVSDSNILYSQIMQVSARLRLKMDCRQRNWEYTYTLNMGILLNCLNVHVIHNLCISVLWCPCMYIVQDSSARLRMYMGIQLIGFWCQIGTWGPEPTKHVAHSVGTTHYTLNMNQRRLQKENTNTEEETNKK